MPTGTKSNTPTETANPSASTGTIVAGASSLQYSVSLSEDTPGALRGKYTYYSKNVGPSSFMMRIDSNSSIGQSIIILDGVQ